MPVATVRLREGPHDPYLEVDGVGIIPGDDEGDFTAPLEVACRAGLTSLRHALIEHAGTTSLPPRTFVHPETGEKVLIPSEPAPYHGRLKIVDVAATKFAQRHTYEFVPEPVELVIREGGALAVHVQFVIEGENEPDPEPLRTLINPLLSQTGTVLDGIDISPEGPFDFRTTTVVTNPDFWVVGVYLAVPIRGRDVAFALSIGADVLAVLEATEDGELTRQTVTSLVNAKRATALVGQPERDWLECKSQPYADTEEGRFELVKDVSAFANSARGGLIILGLRTRSIAGRDIVASVRPIAADSRLPDRYRKLVEHRVFPRPVGIRIETVSYGSSSELMTISIPPQPAALQPFLVKGSLRAGKTVGSQIAIFARRGDATIVTGAEELHSLLMAGRVALGYDRAAGDE